MKTIAVLITLFNRKVKTIKRLGNLFIQNNTNIVESTCSVLKYGGGRGKNVIQSGGKKRECSTFNDNFVLIPNSVYNKLGNLDYKFRHSFGDIE